MEEFNEFKTLIAVQNFVTFKIIIFLFVYYIIILIFSLNDDLSSKFLL